MLKHTNLDTVIFRVNIHIPTWYMTQSMLGMKWRHPLKCRGLCEVPCGDLGLQIIIRFTVISCLSLHSKIISKKKHQKVLYIRKTVFFTTESSEFPSWPQSTDREFLRMSSYVLVKNESCTQNSFVFKSSYCYYQQTRPVKDSIYEYIWNIGVYKYIMYWLK